MARIAFVTGGGRGIGAAIAHRLALDGLRVVIGDLDGAAAVSAAGSLPGKGHLGMALDVTDEAQVEAAFDEVEAVMGPVSVLVCNAGILLFREDGERPKATEISLADWERTFAVNTRGTFLCTRTFLRLRERRPAEQGRIVTLSSSAAQLGGYRSSSAYIASKAAVLGLTKALAREAAPLGITANCVAPGQIDAPMLRQSLDRANDAAAAATIPLNRLGLPEDVAAAVAFLASPEAAYMTGATLDVNGGYRMQ